MNDRIANPWGERNPFGLGEDWPITVDQFLEEGVSEEVDSWVQTASRAFAVPEPVWASRG